jgi:hypothetical protein
MKRYENKKRLVNYMIVNVINSHKPPELPASLFGWILPLLKIGDEEMLTNVGLDALLVRNLDVLLVQR